FRSCLGTKTCAARPLRRVRFHRPPEIPRHRFPVPPATGSSRKLRCRAAYLLHTFGILLRDGWRSLPNPTVDPNSSLGWFRPGCERRAKITNLVINVGRVFDGLRDFSAQETSVTLTHVMELLFYRRLGDSQLRGEFSI